MSKPFEVRFVKPSDFEQWLGLWEGYNVFYERSLPREITDMTWARFSDGYEPMHALVAEQDGQLLGLVHYLFHRNTTMIGPVCYLQDLFTLEAARGQGVARALIEAVYDKAEEQGSTRVYWNTHESNLTAMKLYEKVGKRSEFLQYRKQL